MSDLVIDGCAGPGGLDLGAHALGYDPIGIEKDADACATRAAAGLRTVRADVTQVATAPLAGRLDGLLFSPPCQAWSSAGQRKGEADKPLVWQALADLDRGTDSRGELARQATDPRSLLVVEPLRFALDCRPRWMVWEQVLPCLEIWETCAYYLRRAGYETWAGILNAADYGVPQTRRRAFLLARFDGPVHRPAPTHTGEAPSGQFDMFGQPPPAPWVSMADALGLDGVDRPARTVAGHRAPRWAYGQGNSYSTGWTLHTNRDQRPDGSRQTADPYGGPAPSLTGKSGGQWVLRVGDQVRATARTLDEPAGTLFFGHQKNEVRWTAERPATTVCATDRIAKPGHRDREGGEAQFEDSVRITIEEAAALQSFPADYPFQGTKTARFLQVGNAVPPLLALHVLSAASGVPIPEEHQ